MVAIDQWYLATTQDLDDPPAVLRVLGLVALSLTLLGCAPTLSVGAPCERNSQCEPLACLAGRCRTECVTSRDCPYPLACVNVGNEITACRVTDEEGACRDGASDCAPPLTCVAGSCVEPCADPNTCVIENACVDNICVTPPSITVGECSPVGPSGCGDGDICSRTGDAFGCAPGPSAPTPVGTLCMRQDQCGAGASCVTGRCVRLCIPGSTSCGIGARCHLRDDVFGEITGADRGPLPPEGLGYCTEVCDPLDDSRGCPAGTACSFGVPGSTPPYFFCRSLEIPALDADCGDSIDPDTCVEGTICETEDGTGRQCRPFCDLEDPNSCPDGRECQEISVPGSHFGVCAFPS